MKKRTSHCEAINSFQLPASLRGALATKQSIKITFVENKPKIAKKIRTDISESIQREKKALCPFGQQQNKPGRSGVPLTLIAPLRASALLSATATPPLQPGVALKTARSLFSSRALVIASRGRNPCEAVQPCPSLRAKRSNPLKKSPKPRPKTYSPPFVSKSRSAPSSPASASSSDSSSEPLKFSFSSSLPSKSSSSKSSESSASSSSSSS